MSSDIFGADISATLPAAAKADAGLWLAARAIAREFRRVAGLAPLALLYPNLGMHRDEVLDAIAKDFGFVWYDPNMPRERKLPLLKMSWLIRQRLGTPWAASTALGILFGDSEAIACMDWHEYGGEPFRFRLIAPNIEGADGKAAEFLRMLDALKRRGAWLDTMQIDSRSKAAAHAGAAYCEIGRETHFAGYAAPGPHGFRWGARGEGADPALWPDLSGNGAGGRLSGGCAWAAGGGLELDGATGWAAGPAWRQSGGGFAVEVLAGRAAGTETAGAMAAISCRDGGGGAAITLAGPETAGFSVWDGAGYAEWLMPAGAGRPHTLALSCGGGRALSAVDGECEERALPAGQPAGPAAGGIWALGADPPGGGAWAGRAAHLAGTAHAARLYGRALGAAQLARNARLDAALLGRAGGGG